MLRILRLFFHAYHLAPSPDAAAAAAGVDALQILPPGRIHLWPGQVPVIRRRTWLQIPSIRRRPFNIPKAPALNLTDGQNLLPSVPCSLISSHPFFYVFLCFFLVLWRSLCLSASVPVCVLLGLPVSAFLYFSLCPCLCLSTSISVQSTQCASWDRARMDNSTWLFVNWGYF